MELEKNVSYQNRLKRLRDQLSLSQYVVQHHPFIKGKGGILHILLHRLHLQMQWAIAGRCARLWITFQSALHAQEVEQSQTGFVGPAMQRLQQSAAHLMQVSVHPTERDFTPLLLIFTEIITLGTLYLATHLIENWKPLFPHTEDPLAAEKGGMLLKELGLTFLLGTRAAESAFRSLCQGLGFKERSQKK